MEYPQPITVEFLPVSARSMRVFIRHLCLSYMDVKGVIYNDSVNIHTIFFATSVSDFMYLESYISRSM